MDKTDQQRLELLRKISASSRNTSGSRVRPPSNNTASNPQNSVKSNSSTSSAQPGCNVCSRKKRT